MLVPPLQRRHEERSDPPVADTPCRVHDSPPARNSARHSMPPNRVRARARELLPPGRTHAVRETHRPCRSEPPQRPVSFDCSALHLRNMRRPPRTSGTCLEGLAFEVDDTQLPSCLTIRGTQRHRFLEIVVRQPKVTLIKLNHPSQHQRRWRPIHLLRLVDIRSGLG